MLNTPSVISNLRWPAGSDWDFAGSRDVFVREHLDVRAAQATAVDDARMVRFVGDRRRLSSGLTTPFRRSP